MAGKPGNKRGEGYPDEVKLAFCYEFVRRGSLRGAARAVNVPVGTAAGWLDEPRWQGEVEQIRTVHSRALAERREKMATEIVDGMREAVFVCREALRPKERTVKGKKVKVPCDGRTGARILVSLSMTGAHLDRMDRLAKGEPTEVLGLKETETELTEELSRLLSDPRVRKAYEKALGLRGGR